MSGEGFVSKPTLEATGEVVGGPWVKGTENQVTFCDSRKLPKGAGSLTRPQMMEEAKGDNEVEALILKRELLDVPSKKVCGNPGGTSFFQHCHGAVKANVLGAP
jgi:hypothetical protein